MQVIVDLCVVPLGVGVSVSAYVAECQRVLDAAGLKNQLHAYGTNIEGEWDEVMAVVTACFEAMRADCPRVEVALKVDYRAGDGSRLASKVAAVEERLGRKLATG